MSSSSANISTPTRRARKLPRHRKYQDGLTSAEFKRLFAQRHAEFFKTRGIDPRDEDSPRRRKR